MLLKYKYSQKGYVALALIVFALIISVLIFPFKFPKTDLSQDDGFRYCREFVDEANSTSIDIPIDPGGSQTATHKLIKKNVPIKPEGYMEGTQVTAGEKLNIEEENFQVLYPTPASGRSTDFATEDGVIADNGINFKQYGLVFLLYLDDQDKPQTIDAAGQSFQIIDIYQDSSKQPIPQTESIVQCTDEEVESVVEPEVILPDQQSSENKEQVQLEWFIVKQAKLLSKSWWTPE